MDQVNKQVLTMMTISIIGLCALAKLGSVFEHKNSVNQKYENSQRAKAVSFENRITKGYLEIFLDTDHHPQIAEASVKVPYEEDFPAEYGVLLRF